MCSGGNLGPGGGRGESSGPGNDASAGSQGGSREEASFAPGSANMVFYVY